MKPRVQSVFFFTELSPETHSNTVPESLPLRFPLLLTSCVTSSQLLLSVLQLPHPQNGSRASHLLIVLLCS